MQLDVEIKAEELKEQSQDWRWNSHEIEDNTAARLQTKRLQDWKWNGHEIEDKTDATLRTEQLRVWRRNGHKIEGETEDGTSLQSYMKDGEHFY